MKQTFLWLATLTAIVLVSSADSWARAGQAAKVDVTGVWIFTVESAAGKSNPTLTFKPKFRLSLTNIS